MNLYDKILFKMAGWIIGKLNKKYSRDEITYHVTVIGKNNLKDHKEITQMSHTALQHDDKKQLN